MHTYSTDFVSFSEDHASHIRCALWTYHSARLSYWINVKSRFSGWSLPPPLLLFASGSLESVVDMCAIHSGPVFSILTGNSGGCSSLWEKSVWAHALGWLLFLKCISWKTTCTYNPGEDFTQPVVKERMFINEDCIKEEGEYLCFM